MRSSCVRGTLGRAEGRAGYNVPSLYGLALGAPYLHHGQAPSLPDLFTNERGSSTRTRATRTSACMLADATKVDDLIAFLSSIDASTAELAVPTDPGDRR